MIRRQDFPQRLTTNRNLSYGRLSGESRENKPCKGWEMTARKGKRKTGGTFHAPPADSSYKGDKSQTEMGSFFLDFFFFTMSFSTPATNSMYAMGAESPGL